MTNMKLSICITTYNRGKFIAETLDSIIVQMESCVELIVVDGASPDNTAEVMAQYIANHPEVRYYREEINSGIDGDYDKAVGYAKGEYCWLMSDDDLLNPTAIRHVLSAIDNKKDLIVVNSEIWNADFSNKLLDRRLNFDTDVEFGKEEKEQLFIAAANHLSFIGCVVIRREFWLARERAIYYGTMFIHVGVIFQSPAVDNAMIISEPLIAIRDGNATWSARTFEVWAVKWPALIWSFPDFSDSAKRAICLPDQWKKFKFLFYLRAMGSYSLVEFKKFLLPKAKGADRAMAYLVAAFPGAVANIIVVLFYLLIKRRSRLQLFDVLCSRYASVVSRSLVRSFGLTIPDKK
ncbi:abequosyltransferase RfbV [mine drainage metagenome]|uniref:Abequosyltransferase RfbV n=1 Tax=mine drainage metagenome TaxID=410659 RepID=A0A1J5SI10_9ZZZZ